MGLMSNRRRIYGGITLIPSVTIPIGKKCAFQTDYYPNNRTVYKCSCMITEWPETYNKCLLGTFEYFGNNVTKRSDIQFSINSGRPLDYWYGDIGTTVARISPYTINTKYDIECGNGYIIMNGSMRNSTVVSAWICPYPLMLFSNSQNGVLVDYSGVSFFTGVVYGSIGIYENGVLVRNYHPAKKNGRIGFYETVYGRMYFSYLDDFEEY